MIRALALLLLIGAAIAVEFDVDQRWYSPTDSHHAEHLVGGAALGATAYALTSLVTDSKPTRFLVSIGGTAVVAALWEIDEAGHGSDSTAFADPVDMAWTTVGAVLGAVVSDVIADAIGQDFTLIPRHDGGAMALAFHF